MGTLSSSPNRKDDTWVDGLHNEAYCLFKPGRMRSLRLRTNFLFDDSKRTAAWEGHSSAPQLNHYMSGVQHIDLTKAMTVPSGKPSHCSWSPGVTVAKFVNLS